MSDVAQWFRARLSEKLWAALADRDREAIIRYVVLWLL